MRVNAGGTRYEELVRVDATSRSEACADVYGIPSTQVYTMMSWLHECPMEEHVAVEFWSGSGPPGKCLQTL